MVRVRGIEPRSQPSEGSALNPLDDTRKTSESGDVYGIRTRDLLLERQRTWPTSQTRHGAASRNRTCIPELEAPRP